MNMEDAHSKGPELTVVVPVFNEAGNVPLLVSRLKPALESCVASFEIVFVDDGSSDDTLAALKAENARDPRVRAVSFSHGLKRSS